MEKLIIFYDDKKKSCCDCAEWFSRHENVECRKASGYLDQRVIFATGGRVGIIFESEKGKVPRSILYVIGKLIADKTERHMILVTGGQKELRAIHTAGEIMWQRGYYPAYIYTRYLFEKNKLKKDETVAWVLNELEENRESIRIKDEYKNMSTREIRRHLRAEMKECRRYRKGMH